MTARPSESRPLRQPPRAPDRPALLATGMVLLAMASPAQAPYQGNGVGQAYLHHTMVRIGSTFEARFGSPAIPFGICVLGFSDGLGPTNHPYIGAVGLDLLSPVFSALTFGLDGFGNGQMIAAIPSGVSQAQLPPLYAALAVCEPTVISVSKTTRLVWENADSYALGGPLGVARAAHTATALGGDPRDNETRILITGGGGGSILVPQATQSTEIYSVLTRSSTPGPAMAVQRALHQAIRLPDGRVLVCGGVDAAGNVTTNAELYDPAQNLFVAAAPMLNPRAGHAATLLGNGKVLVTGGLSNYQNPTTNLAAVLNTAQDTGELFDPQSGLWSAVPGTMNSKRSGHSQTLLPDGRVLICGGIAGGTTVGGGFDIPVFTAFCGLYDPAGNAFSATGTMTFARAFHGASVLASGDVLVTGGTVANPLFGIVGAIDACERWNGSTFATVGQLSTPVTNHVQLRADDGRALIFGGLTGIFPTLVGTAVAGRHDGTSFVAAGNVGDNPGLPGAVPLPAGAAQAVRVFDGSIALFGGSDGVAPLASAVFFLQ